MFDQQLRRRADARLGRAQIELLDCRFVSICPLRSKQPLQIDGPQRGRRIVARQLQPLARADLVLQPEQVELIALHLPHQPLADEQVAHARRRDGNDARTLKRSQVSDVS